MAVKIKLMRMGKIRAPYYRIVVADARTKRDGRAIEQIGKYHPKQEPSLIEIDSDRAQHWLSRGAQPTSPVRSLLKITGDWQKFRGEPGSEGSLKTGGARPDKKEAFAAALKEVHGESTTEASRPKSRGKKADDGKTAKAEKAADKAGQAAETTKGDKAEQAAKAGTDESTAVVKAESEAGDAESKTAKGSSGSSGAARSTAAKRRGSGGSPEKAAAADSGAQDATSGKSGSGA